MPPLPQSPRPRGDGHTYNVVLTHREFGGQAPRDWHISVMREDGEEAVAIAAFRWLARLRVRQCIADIRARDKQPKRPNPEYWTIRSDGLEMPGPPPVRPNPD